MKTSGIVFCLFILAAAIFFLSKEITKESKEVTTPPEVRQIGLYHYYSGSLSGGISEMINEINTSQKNFRVQAQALDHEAFKSMIYTTLDKGDPPELFTYWAGSRVQSLVERDKLAPIDDLWAQEKFDTRFSPSVIEAACTYNGKKYLVPIDQFVVLFFYNKSIFTAAGLEPPDTWQAFLNLCRTLKEPGTTPIALGSKERWPAQFWLDYLLLRTKGMKYRTRLMKGQAKYTDKEVQNVYKIWGGLLQKGYFNKNANDLDWAQATQLVCRGQAAMTLMGSWAIQTFKNQEACPGIGEGFDFFAFPQIDKQVEKVALGPIDGIVLSKNSANHEYAKQTMAYFAKTEPQQRLSIGSGALAPSLDVPHSFYSPLQKRIIAEIQTASAWAFNYDLATPPEIAELGMNSFQELIEFPGEYMKILKNVEREAKIIFKKQSISSQKE